MKITKFKFKFGLDIMFQSYHLNTVFFYYSKINVIPVSGIWTLKKYLEHNMGCVVSDSIIFIFSSHLLFFGRMSLQTQVRSLILSDSFFFLPRENYHSEIVSYPSCSHVFSKFMHLNWQIKFSVCIIYNWMSWSIYALWKG